MATKYATDEERLAARREALRRYNNSGKGKANEARRDKEKARAAYARYRTTEGYAAAQERRRLKDRAAGWPIQSVAAKRLREQEPERFSAYTAVGIALRIGLLVRPDQCERCGDARRLHGHHHNGYSRAHWLDVQWFCSPCHRTEHR